MAILVVMPTLGMTMEEGKVAEWLTDDGQFVEQGQLIARLSTDKIEIEVEAEAKGTIHHLVAEDAVALSGAVLACILEAGEALPSQFATATEHVAAQKSGVAIQAQAETAQPASPPSPSSAGIELRASPAARRLARELGVDLTPVSGTGPGGRIVEEDVRRHSEASPAAAEVAVRASPLAKRLAGEHGMDLTRIQGSGPGGRIVHKDVERAIAQAGASGPEAQAAAKGQTLPFRGIRRTIAERMQQSLQSMAQLTVTMDVDATEMVRMVTQIREEWRRQGVHITYIDPVIKAVAVALREHPRLNAALEGEVIRLLPEINIGVAIALEEGLIVPVVRQADARSLRDIAQEVHELSNNARAGTLTHDDVSGGSFTVTSLAMYDVDVFTPIINPPQAAILGIGRVRETPAFEGEQVVRRLMMHLSLSFDHRVLDGAPAAQFLRRVRNLLERPYLLLF